MPCGLKPSQVVVVGLTGAGMSTTPLGYAYGQVIYPALQSQDMVCTYI